jgi:hypothetical protein
VDDRTSGLFAAYEHHLFIASAFDAERIRQQNQTELITLGKQTPRRAQSAWTLQVTNKTLEGQLPLSNSIFGTKGLLETQKEARYARNSSCRGVHYVSA